MPHIPLHQVILRSCNGRSHCCRQTSWPITNYIFRIQLQLNFNPIANFSARKHLKIRPAKCRPLLNSIYYRVSTLRECSCFKFLLVTRNCYPYIANIATTNHLATHVANTLTSILLMLFPQNILITITKWLISPFISQQRDGNLTLMTCNVSFM